MQMTLGLCPGLGTNPGDSVAASPSRAIKCLNFVAFSAAFLPVVFSVCLELVETRRNLIACNEHG